MGEARKVLSARYAGELGLPPESAYSVMEAQLSKALPQQLRLTLPELSPAERLAFTPLGSTGPDLDAVLAGFSVPTSDSVFRLNELFHLSEPNDGNSPPSPYADCLPTVPRDIQNVYYSLAGILASSEGMAGATAAAQIVVESAIQNGFRRSPSSKVSPEGMFHVARTTEDDVPQMILDFTSISYVRRWKEEVVTLHSNYGEHEVGFDFGALSVPRSSVESGEDAPVHHLDSALTLGLLLAREFSNHGRLFSEEISGGEPVSGGRSSPILNISVGASDGDSYFLVLPRWVTFYDYFVFDHVWRVGMLNASRTLDQHNVTDAPHVVAALAIVFIRIVAEVQLNRSALPLEVDDIRLLITESDTEALLRRLWDETASVVEKAISHADDSSRYGKFRTWVTSLMPMACHPWILPRWMLEELLALRNVLVGSREGHAELRVILQQRIRSHLGEDWVTPMLEVLSQHDYLELDAVCQAHEYACEQRQRLSFAMPPVSDLKPPELARDAIAVLNEMVTDLRRSEAAE